VQAANRIVAAVTSGTHNTNKTIIGTNGIVIHHADTLIVFSNTVAGGSGSVLTNANQFGATADGTLTIKTAALVTNINSFSQTNTSAAVTSVSHTIVGSTTSQTNLVEWMMAQGTIAGGVKSNAALVLPNGTASFPSLGWLADDDGTGSGIFRSSANAISLSANGTAQMQWNTLGIQDGGAAWALSRGSQAVFGLWNGGEMGWVSGSSITAGFTLDTKLARDGPNIVAQRNGTIAQTNRVFGTYTSATVGEFLEHGYSGPASAFFLRAMTNTGGSTTLRSLYLGAGTNRAGIVITPSNAPALFAGGSTTLAKIGGTLSVATTPVENAGASETNLITYSVPAHALTNDGDRLVIRASGRFAANANAKQIKLVLGSETVLDTTSQIANGGAWIINAEIICTGSTAQTVSADYEGTAATLFTLAAAATLAQTNGIATVLKLTGTAASGDITNRTLTVEYRPAP
jgi:hypothetical protein